jgi:hypothetical protein
MNSSDNTAVVNAAVQSLLKPYLLANLRLCLITHERQVLVNVVPPCVNQNQMTPISSIQS